MCCGLFFKQKTAYEMRISDWSADVCSSDLYRLRAVPAPRRPFRAAAPAFPASDPPLRHDRSRAAENRPAAPDATGGSSRSGPARRPVRQRPSSRDGLLPEVLQRMEQSGTHISINASARARGQAFCPFPQNNQAVLASRDSTYVLRSRRGGAISSPARLPLPFTTAIDRKSVV